MFEKPGEEPSLLQEGERALPISEETGHKRMHYTPREAGILRDSLERELVGRALHLMTEVWNLAADTGPRCRLNEPLYHAADDLLEWLDAAGAEEGTA